MRYKDNAKILIKGRLSISDEIYNHILMNIVEGRWEVGEKIPSEKALCEMFGVSQVSIRTALDRLATQGLVVTRQGKGSYVKGGGAVTRNGADLEIDFAQRDEILQFAAFRQCTETKVAELFIQKATETDYQELQALSDQIGAAQGLSEMAERDLAFHEKLVRTCGNQYLIKCWEMFRNAYEWNFLNAYKKNHYNPAEIQRQHQEILNALRNKDAKAAMSIILQGFIR